MENPLQPIHVANTLFLQGIILNNDTYSDKLTKIGADLEDIQHVSAHMSQYLQYRDTNPLHRYNSHLFTRLYTIDERFWKLLDLVFCVSFCKGVHAAQEMPEAAAHGTEIFLNMVEFMPRLVPALVPEGQYDEDSAAELFVFCCPEYLKMIYDELDHQSAFISELLKRDILARNDLISNEMHQLLRITVEKRFSERLL